MRYDAIVLGADANGLTAATLLAREGLRVIVLEGHAQAGRLAAMEEFHPGYRVPGVLTDTSSLRRWVVDELQLERHGLQWRRESPPTWLAHPGGHGLLLHRDPARMQARLQAGSEQDARRYVDFRSFIGRIHPVVRKLMDETPPRLGRAGMGGLLELLGPGMALRRLGKDDMLELARVIPMCTADWLNEYFEDERLKAGLAAPAHYASFTGPWSPGTAGLLLLQLALAGEEVHGGAPSLIESLLNASKTHGVELQCNSSRIKAIRTAEGRAVGIELEDGRPLSAEFILSSYSPRKTLSEWLPVQALPLESREAVRRIRSRGTTAILRLALNGPLQFRGEPGVDVERARTGGHLDDIERAYDSIKYGRFSEYPQLEIHIPTIADASLAPKGHHVVHCLVHFAPHELDGGWTEAAKQALGAAAVRVLEEHSYGLSERIVAREVLTPVDLEQRFDLPQGHLYQGEHALDQLASLRPTRECAQYETPLSGLYLCGSGTHPGGELSCVSGFLAAKAVLRKAR